MIGKLKEFNKIAGDDTTLLMDQLVKDASNYVGAVARHWVACAAAERAGAGDDRAALAANISDKDLLRHRAHEALNAQVNMCNRYAAQHGCPSLLSDTRDRRVVGRFAQAQ